MHTFHHTVPSNPVIDPLPRSDAFWILLILAVVATTGTGFSILASDPDRPSQPSATAGLEDWHGNVARSGG